MVKKLGQKSILLSTYVWKSFIIKNDDFGYMNVPTTFYERGRTPRKKEDNHGYFNKIQRHYGSKH